MNPKMSPKFQDVRNNLERRVTTPQMSAMLRVRNAATQAINHFFQKEEFVQIHTPIITTNDCEGAGETFQIQLRNDQRGKKTEKQFFDVPTFLTVSAQLHLEMVNNAISKVYTFSPTFRGENSRTRQHLSEFYMVEAELAFTQNLENIMEVIEDLVKTSTEQIYNLSEEDVNICLSKSEMKEPETLIENLLKNQFVRLSYDDAIDILVKKNHMFKHNVEWGCDLQKEHEFSLVDHCGGIPVFLTDFPAAIKPFYMRVNDDGRTVAAVDLLLPEVGELCGGSLREERYDLIRNKVTPDLKWYADLRRCGTFPHGGFGLGFDRYLMLLLGVTNIRDVVVFPRWTHNCQF
ncbi:hypothetical protein CAPTEDRAFT_163999 [Capitella teleta]|uniref:asparagine--tRNA ligase n=1 Tax=Capitella teleta TaxID=283909 RepID=R7V2U6_CAPTE|nr:hypothetical protein CAPTEDRAFT_163999 [Capitella teleta]|eukprot:ELU12802.1 hypothetical protein CAPTEDRAFT_163999 [Capitella teleta]